jgi:hypothetical protein
VGILLAYWLIRGLYRVIRWLVVPGDSMQPVTPARAAPIARGRLEQATRRAAEGGFGRRSR